MIGLTIQFEIYSFVDYFAGYYQIMLAEEDRDKATFILHLAHFARGTYLLALLMPELAFG